MHSFFQNHLLKYNYVPPAEPGVSDTVSVSLHTQGLHLRQLEPSSVCSMQKLGRSHPQTLRAGKALRGHLNESFPRGSLLSTNLMGFAMMPILL